VIEVLISFGSLATLIHTSTVLLWDKKVFHII